MLVSEEPAWILSAVLKIIYTLQTVFVYDWRCVCCVCVNIWSMWIILPPKDDIPSPPHPVVDRFTQRPRENLIWKVSHHNTPGRCGYEI